MTRCAAARNLGSTASVASLIPSRAAWMAQAQAMWKLRESVPEAQRRHGASLKHDVSVPVSAIPTLIEDGTALVHRLAPEGDVVSYGHAGDGNLHPLILFNANDADEARRAEIAGAEILKLCVAVGGCLTGEHGVGIEKRDLMEVQFSPSDLAVQMRIKSVFDPLWLLNPGKVFPLTALESNERPAADQAA